MKYTTIAAVCCLLSVVFGAFPISESSHWDLSRDIQTILEVSDSLGFDDTGLYEKYMTHRGMSTARYITTPQIKHLFAHVTQHFPDLAALVQVDNEPGDLSLITKEYQQVLKLGKGKPSASSILLTGAHHSRELTSI